jgi:quercetin dioxygenase-like cupin family protein
MNNKLNRRQAIKTMTASSLGAAFAASLGTSALAEQAKATPFNNRRALDNSLWLGQNLLSILADAASTNGAYTLVEASSPAGAVFPPHVHTHEEETIFMLEGEMEITVGDNVIIAKPGDHVYMPRGIVHALKMVTTTRGIVMFTPGGLEGVYRQLGRPAERLELPPTPPAPTAEQQQRIAEVFASYGYYFQ